MEAKVQLPTTQLVTLEVLKCGETFILSHGELVWIRCQTLNNSREDIYITNITHGTVDIVSKDTKVYRVVATCNPEFALLKD